MSPEVLHARCDGRRSHTAVSISLLFASLRRRRVSAQGLASCLLKMSCHRCFRRWRHTEGKGGRSSGRAEGNQELKRTQLPLVTAALDQESPGGGPKAALTGVGILAQRKKLSPDASLLYWSSVEVLTALLSS